MAGEQPISLKTAHQANWTAEDQSLLGATLAATPTQRIAWLEEALRLAYATGALKPKRLITKQEWDAMGSTPQ
ncbi:MAG: hypothetical protein P0111_16480 [Nitrospira sp.]|nr:hypothetical protein [Nitrospira sp.]